MKDVFVEMMAGPVIAEVQPEHVAAETEQVAAEREHIETVGTALPAVQQDREIPRRRAARGRLTRVVAEQANAVAAVDDLRVGASKHVSCAAREQRPAQ